MTTEDMRIALLWHFRWRMQYPLVTTECIIGDYNFSDILAIKKTIVVEVEIKQRLAEVLRDLTNKSSKHRMYLDRNELYFQYSYQTRPNKFYFALPDEQYQINWDRIIAKVPDVYGLIAIYELYNCRVMKRARYLTKNNSSLEVIRDIVNKRLTAENIDLRLKLAEKAKKWA